MYLVIHSDTKLITDNANNNFLGKLLKHFFQRFIGRLFYQSRIGILKPQGIFKLAITEFNQRLNENGYAPRCIYTKKECIEF